MNTISNSNFCLQIANQVLQKEANNGSNSVLSPLSFQVMLSLIAAGSTGRTLKQFLLHLGSENIHQVNLLSSKLVALVSRPREDTNLAAGPLISFANGAWVDQSFGLKRSFRSIAEDFFKARVKEVDFVNKADEVRDEVNSWAGSVTNGLIKDILPLGSLDQDTALVLANALYFKGAWNRIFDKTRTKTMDFHLVSGQKVQVPFMTSRYYEKHLYRDYGEYKVLQIPYQAGQDVQKFSMLFFLPAKNDGLQNLLYDFRSNPGFFNQEFDLEEEELPNFWIPRFKFSYEFEASTIIKNLGLDLPFMNLDGLDGMVDSPSGNKLCVSKIYHKSYIEVNEEGTEAAASTAAAIMLCCARFPTPSFVADHPFVFMVREETSKVVLFTGAVLNPV